MQAFVLLCTLAQVQRGARRGVGTVMMLAGCYDLAANSMWQKLYLNMDSECSRKDWLFEEAASAAAALSVLVSGESRL